MIKNILLGVCLTTCLTTLASTALATTPHEHCKSIEEVAKLTQMYNQKQLSMSTLYEEGQQLPSGMQKLYYMIVEEAYQQPRYSSYEYQQKAIREYGNRWYKACMQNL